MVLVRVNVKIALTSLQPNKLVVAGNYPKPQELCRLCHREFHGTQCYNYHLAHVETIAKHAPSVK